MNFIKVWDVDDKMPLKTNQSFRKCMMNYKTILRVPKDKSRNLTALTEVYCTICHRS